MSENLHLSALKRGCTVLTLAQGIQKAGKVLLVASRKLGLEFSEDISSLFQPGHRVEVFYWGESESGNTWEAEVLSVVGHGKQLQLGILSWREDQRRHPRTSKPLPFSGTVEHSAEKGLVGRQFTAVTNNLSAGGLLFETRLPLSVGDGLKITLTPVGAASLRLSGSVVRKVTVRGKQGLGSRTSDAVFQLAVQFVEVSEEEGRIVGWILNTPPT